MKYLRKRGYLLEVDLYCPFPSSDAAAAQELSRQPRASWTGPVLTFEGYQNLLSRSGMSDIGSEGTGNLSGEEFDVHLHFLPLPPWLLSIRKTALRRFQDRGSSALQRDDSVNRDRIVRAFPQLYPYQIHGVLQFERRDRRMLLADPMGLGKTAQACACILLSQKAKNVLIVCPASVRNNWEIELSIWEKNFVASGNVIPGTPSAGDEVEEGEGVQTEPTSVFKRQKLDGPSSSDGGEQKAEDEGTVVSELPGTSKQRTSSSPSPKKKKEGPSSSFRVLKTGKTPLVPRAIVSYSILPSVLQQLEEHRKNRRHQNKKPKPEEGTGKRKKQEDATLLFDRYDLIVLDEAHFIKNIKSQRTKAFLKLLKFCEQEREDPVGLLFLSGTPVSRPSEMFVFFRTLLPFQDTGEGRRSLGTQMFPWAGQGQPKFYPGTLGKSLPESFGYRYCLPKAEYVGRGQVQISLTGYDRQREFEALVGLITLRREKKEVLDLPPKVRNTIHLDGATVKEIRRFKEALDSLSSLAEDKGKRAVEIKLMQLVSETMRIKMKILPSWLKDTLFPLLQLHGQGEEDERKETENLVSQETPEREKYLLFAHHHEVLDFLAEKLEEAGIGFISIDGRTPPKDRQTLVQDFRDKDNILVAVLGIQSAGTGLNFQTATQVIFVELTWSEKDILQAEDRAHRIGVRGTVFIHYLCLQGSTDEFMLRAIQKKTRTAQHILQETNL